MDIFIGLIVLLALIIICKWLSRYFTKLGDQLNEEAAYKKYHEACIRESLEDIRGSVVQPEEEPVDMRERLLQANKEIIKKEKLNNAIEDELGIKM